MYSRNWESFIIPAVNEAALPTEIQGLPGGKPLVDAILERCPVIVVTNPTDQLPLPFDGPNDRHPADPHLSQINPRHARSFVLDELSDTKPWSDEYGHSYSGVTLKGNNFTEPRLIENDQLPTGYAFYGLQDSTVVGRCIRASQALRQIGVSTEYILGMAEPKLLRWPLDAALDSSQTLTRQEYKQRLVHDTWQAQPDTEKSFEGLAELSTKMQRLTFYILMRAMDTNYRLADLYEYVPRFESDTTNPEVPAVDELSQHPYIAAKVFAHYNQYYLPDNVQPYTVGDTIKTHFTEVDRFVREVTIPRMAKNIAIMHHNGIGHRFLTEGNITAYGSPIDVDSVYGEPLGIGDEPITDEDIIQDLDCAFSALDFIAEGHFRITYQAQSHVSRKERQSQFLEQYTAHRLEMCRTAEDRLRLLELAAEMNHFVFEDEVTQLTALHPSESLAQKMSLQIYDSLLHWNGAALATAYLDWLQSDKRIIESLMDDLEDNAYDLAHAFGQSLINGEVTGITLEDFVRQAICKNTTARDDVIEQIDQKLQLMIPVFIRECDSNIVADNMQLAHSADNTSTTKAQLALARAAAHILEIQLDTKDFELWVSDVVIQHLLQVVEAILPTYAPCSPADILQIGEHAVAAITDQQLVYETYDTPLNLLMSEVNRRRMDFSVHPSVEIKHDSLLSLEFTVPEDGVLEQIISDHMTEGSSIEFAVGTSRIEHLTIDPHRDSRFTAFVYRTNDLRQHIAIYLHDDTIDGQHELPPMTNSSITSRQLPLPNMHVPHEWHFTPKYRDIFKSA